MLDRNSVGMDMDVSIFNKLGEFEAYDVADRESCKKWIQDANVIIFNKSRMDEDMLQNAPNVQLLCVTATGFDNIDLEYARKRNIAVANVRDYSTPAVAQHTFALALYVLEKIGYYDNYVKSGAYSDQLGFSNFDEKYTELEGKTWGIIGLGNIGKRVASIATAFGCKVIFYSASGNNDIQFGKGKHSAVSVYSLDLTTFGIDYKIKNGTWAETYDVLIKEIKSSDDTDLRFELMHLAEDMLMETGCILPLYYYTDVYMVSSNLKGFYSNPLGCKYFMHTTIDTEQ